LGDLVEQCVEPVDLDPEETYINLGVKWYAEGTFRREPKVGGEIKAKRLFRVRPGQFVYNRLFATEGSFAVVQPGDAVAVASNEFPVFDVDASELLVEYLGLYFQQPRVWARVAQECVGTTKSRSRWKEERLREHSFDLPPLEQQQRIVDLLGALDEVVDGCSQVRSVLESAWWAACQTLEYEVLESETVALGGIAEIGGGIAKNSADAARPDAAEAPYLRAANVQRRFFDLGEVSTITATRSKIQKALLLPGDILMNEGGDRDKLGRGAVWRGQVEGCVHQNHVFRVRLTTDRFLPEFVSAWANSYGRRWFDTNGSQTTGIASISKTTLSRFPVPEVALSRQQEWVDALDELDATAEAAAEGMRSLEELRSHMLTVLLSGEHEIPASYDELLEGVSA
jgi:type I restriction enzyme S subunit